MFGFWPATGQSHFVELCQGLIRPEGIDSVSHACESYLTGITEEGAVSEWCIPDVQETV